MVVQTYLTPRAVARGGRAWEAAQTRKRFTAKELQSFAAVSEPFARHLVRTWTAEGRVTVAVPGGQGKAVVVAVVPDWKPQGAGVPRTADLNMWTTMRGLREFAPTDVAVHSDTPDQPVTVATATTYCRALLTAGYVTVRSKAVPGRREARYRLVRDTGPLAPVVRRVLALCDPNERVLTPVGFGVPWA